MNKIEPFLGLWKLIPEQSKYESGTPPQSGSYEIIGDGQQLTFKMDWVDSTGQQKQMTFSEICDGQFHPYADNSAVDEICLKLASPTLSESHAKQSGELQFSASRELLSNHSMKIIQSGKKPDGTWFKNISWYKKIK